MKVQRVERLVGPMATPNDTARLQALADSGAVKPESLVALAGKTEGAGFQDDCGRVLADFVLREWTARFFGVPVSPVAERVTFVLSGRCPGVITLHITAVTREWEEVKETSLDGPGYGC